MTNATPLLDESSDCTTVNGLPPKVSTCVCGVGLESIPSTALLPVFPAEKVVWLFTEPLPCVNEFSAGSAMSLTTAEVEPKPPRMEPMAAAGSAEVILPIVVCEPAPGSSLDPALTLRVIVDALANTDLIAAAGSAAELLAWTCVTVPEGSGSDTSVERTGPSWLGSAVEPGRLPATVDVGGPLSRAEGLSGVARLVLCPGSARLAVEDGRESDTGATDEVLVAGACPLPSVELGDAGVVLMDTESGVLT